jgi:hypothetical protein
VLQADRSYICFSSSSSFTFFFCSVVLKKTFGCIFSQVLSSSSSSSSSSSLHHAHTLSVLLSSLCVIGVCDAFSLQELMKAFIQSVDYLGMSFALTSFGGRRLLPVATAIGMPPLLNSGELACTLCELRCELFHRGTFFSFSFLPSFDPCQQRFLNVNCLSRSCLGVSL